MYARTISLYDFGKMPEPVKVEIPDVFIGNGRKEHADVLPRMRAIAALWDAGHIPTSECRGCGSRRSTFCNDCERYNDAYNWAVYANDGTFILNI